MVAFALVPAGDGDEGAAAAKSPKLASAEDNEGAAAAKSPKLVSAAAGVAAFGVLRAAGFGA